MRQVLTPAACYHAYLDLAGQDLLAPAFLTLSAPCYRREPVYEPLRRQWVFHMREIVCVGTADEVKVHLATHRLALEALAERLGLPTSFALATDPFFNPGRSARYLMQKVDPTKEELVYGGDLAIASLNYHRDTMGGCFEIRRGGRRLRPVAWPSVWSAGCTRWSTRTGCRAPCTSSRLSWRAARRPSREWPYATVDLMFLTERWVGQRSALHGRVWAVQDTLVTIRIHHSMRPSSWPARLSSKSKGIAL